MNPTTYPADIVGEFGPYPGNAQVNGVTYDGDVVWWASDKRLNAMDPASGEIVRFLEVPAHAGTAYDGKHLYQVSEGHIHKINPETGDILSTIPAPSADDNSGLAWAEGSLWIGQYEGRKIHQLDPQTGAILRTIASNRMVTGVTWADGDLWHGTWDDDSELRRIDPHSGEVLETLTLPPDIGVSGLESDGQDRFFCGGGGSGKVRVVRRPNKKK
ncbi:Vgb family protein [Prosthecobacter dejongeii]|uniref:Outer membrane protein assembly factor BamB n=1 Tax=Prosthecobacter dejongeii TaxID=48465 RepID=A0A7W7YI91_9BACT|nr:glutamine cyclotransferase [Prosthecobacter dejongeii]MBB5036624.1 outer membrane protein assembly factor BamB [Prosthecobacter dejongeii]